MNKMEGGAVRTNGADQKKKKKKKGKTRDRTVKSSLSSGVILPRLFFFSPVSFGEGACWAALTQPDPHRLLLPST